MREVAFNNVGREDNFCRFSGEWKLLQNLPKINVLKGDPLSRADMRAVKIDQCRLCIVLSAKVPTRDEPVLADKEVLLTALNIKALRWA